MYTIIMTIKGRDYIYGTYADRNRANEIAMDLRLTRDIEVGVYEAEVYEAK